MSGLIARHLHTGARVAPGDAVTSHRGEPGELVSVDGPNTEHYDGTVTVQWADGRTETFSAMVVGLKVTGS